MSDEEREALIASMQFAGAPSEVEVDMDAARRWLQQHPGDDRVAAAMQRLEEREERLSDAGNEPGRQAAVATVVAGLIFGAAVYLVSGSRAYSMAAALFIGVELGFWGWGVATSALRRTRRNRTGR